jgi:hypothetical protein
MSVARAGQAQVIFYDRPGFQLVLRLRARPGYVRAVLELNGAPVRSARRPTLTSALRWALTLSQRLLDVFGQRPPTIDLSEVLRQVARQLAA